MASLNHCHFIGRLGADPETRYTAQGTAQCNISIACDEKWRDKQSGELKERVEWVRVVFWGKLAETAGQYLKKGGQVYVAGRLQTRSWEKDGRTHYMTEVQAREMVLLGSSGGGRPQQAERERQEPRYDPPPSSSADEPFDDDIPF